MPCKYESSLDLCAPRTREHPANEKHSSSALEKIIVVRSEKASREPKARNQQGVARERAAGEGQAMILTDEPIVGGRLKPALTKSAFEVEGFLDPTEALD